MFKLLARLWSGAAPSLSDPRTSSGFLPTQLVDTRPDPQRLVTWASRMLEIAALTHDRAHGASLLARLLGSDGQHALGAERERRLLSSYLDFTEVQAGKQVIRQDERGDYLMILLEGSVSVERTQPSGARARLLEALPGDLLGELAGVEADTRYCACTTLAPCVFAVLKPQSLEWMIRAEPRLAALLMIWLSRRLSLGLRHLGTRLTGVLTRT